MNLVKKTPQDIQLELKYGKLTLKAGATFYIPNGVGVFDKYTIQNDIIIQNGKIGNQSVDMIFSLGSDGQVAMLAPEDRIISGDTPPTVYIGNFWYDTLNNIIKKSTDAGQTWFVPENKVSLPLGVYYRQNGVAKIIKKTFNGFGYFNSVLFALPGVVEQMPSGRDVDGNAYFEEISVDKVLTNNNYNGEYAYLKGKNGIANEIIVSESGLKYNDTSNIFSGGSKAIFYYNYSIYDKINVVDTIKASNNPLSQYANSRVYMNLYNGLANIFSNAKTIEDWYNIVFNLKTASGYGLDIWGNILNQGRQFSYDDNGTTVYVFLGGEQTIDGITYSAEYMEEMYRMVLFLKALTYITNCTLASLNSLLQYYFRDRIDPKNNQNVYVINYGTMAIRYVFQFYVSKIEQSIFTSDVMPRPTGVLANFEFVPYGEYFGFFVDGEETQPYTPFDNKPFFR